MQKANKVNSKRIVFSRWSRKSYAVFASLQKVVHIARLSVDICKTALLKSPALVGLIRVIADDNTKQDDEVCEELQDNQQLMQLLPVVAINSNIAPKQGNIINNNSGKPIFCIEQNMGFLLFNPFEDD